MKVAVCYVYPLVNPFLYQPLALRFRQTYQFVPSGYPHELHLLFNGGQPNEAALRSLGDLSYQPHYYNNQGWDIGAYQKAAEDIPCDLMVCLGAPVHFHKPDWLLYMAHAYILNGPALYGCWAYLAPNWHVRTTCFWFPPDLLKAYPHTITSSRASRYEFEHGNNSITRFTLSAGMECWMVTRSGTYPFSQWQDHAPGPDDSLVLDQFTHR